jgi:hypothetical protein
MGDASARVLEEIAKTVRHVGREPICIPGLALEQFLEAPKDAAPRDQVETAIGESPLHDVGCNISDNGRTAAPNRQRVRMRWGDPLVNVPGLRSQA